MPFIMMCFLTIYPIFLTASRLRMRAKSQHGFSKKMQPVLQEGSIHIKPIVVPIGRSQGTHLGVGHGGAGADKAEYRSEEGRVYSQGALSCERKSDVGSLYHRRTPASHACAT